MTTVSHVWQHCVANCVLMRQVNSQNIVTCSTTKFLLANRHSCMLITEKTTEGTLRDRRYLITGFTMQCEHKICINVTIHQIHQYNEQSVVALKRKCLSTNTVITKSELKSYI